MEKVHSTVCALLFAFVAIAPFSEASAKGGGLSGKPGNCPPLSWFGVVRVCPYIRSDGCASDFHCPGNEKCCFSGCGPVCVDPFTPPPPPPPPPPPSTNPGDCPAPIYTDLRWCARVYQIRCTCDQDCGKILKCCNNGCGLTCVKPVIAPPPPPPPPSNPGSCPAPIYTDPRWCASVTQRTCTCDQDCGRILKCCNNGCGFTCVKPVLAPPPPPPPPATNPGDCPAPIYTNLRWCAKIYQRSCTCDQDCGKILKCCNNGCGLTCAKPVLDPPPPPPPPTNPGSCPAPIYTDPRWCASVSQRRCTCDQDCGRTLKCCNNGCGPTCVEPVLEKPGSCPRPTGYGICIQECDNDANCPKHLKCCSNGCGNVCTAPVRKW